MRKLLKQFNLLSLVATALVLSTTACSDDDKPEAPVEAPTFNVTVKNLERTSVDFAIESAQAADYAYVITEKDGKEFTDPEEVFEEGSSGMLEDGHILVNTIEMEGGKEYKLYVATRKINPYVYSDVKVVDLNTSIPYDRMLTLDKIGYTDFKYHIEKPADVERVMHLVVRKNDYEGVKKILESFGEVTEEGYLEAFGHSVTESTDIYYDKYGKDASGDGYDVHIHSNTTFLAMTGVVDEDGKIDRERFECVEFNTRKAEVSPCEFDVVITPTSTSALVTITPQEGIVSYRALVDSKDEYEYCRREGEQQVRYHIIGHWDDSTNPVKREYNGVNQITASGLIPNKSYIVGIVGFDAQGREKVKMVEFVTGQPTGPAPTVNISEVTPSVATPWNTKAFNVKAMNAVEIRYGFWPKARVDEVVGSGSSLELVIQNNGVQCSDEQLEAILSADGMVFETNDLEPETEYLFGIYARTEEYVVTIDSRVFTTEELPQTGGAVRKNMPGRYIASTTDENGDEVTFPVVISTGVNDATISDYSSKNRLVALGFGPADEFPYQSPEETVSDEPDAYYGPKWFIEFTDDKICVPSASGKAWSMGLVDGIATYIKGFGVRQTANGPRDMEFDDEFLVEVSEDGNIVTVKGTFHDIGQGGTCYPAMLTPGSGWFSPNVYHFKCYSDLVLTRQPDNTASLLRAISMPKTTIVKVGVEDSREDRKSIADKLK